MGEGSSVVLGAVKEPHSAVLLSGMSSCLPCNCWVWVHVCVLLCVCLCVCACECVHLSVCKVTVWLPSLCGRQLSYLRMCPNYGGQLEYINCRLSRWLDRNVTKLLNKYVNAKHYWVCLWKTKICKENKETEWIKEILNGQRICLLLRQNYSQLIE